jgi:phage portal protein BeeE
MNILGFEIKRKAAVMAGNPNLPFMLRYLAYLLQGYSQNTKDYIDKGYQGNAIVYAIVKQLSDKYASVPLIVYRKKKGKNNAVKRYKALSSGYNPDANFSALKLKAEAFDEVGEDNELQQLVDKYGVKARSQGLGFKLLVGARALFVNSGATGGKPLSIDVLPPQWFNIKPSPTLDRIEEFELAPEGVKIATLTPEQLVWDAYFNPDWQRDGEHLRGQSPLMAAMKDVLAHNYGKEAQAFMYKNGGARGAMVPDNIDVQRELNSNPLAPSRVREDLDALVNGLDNKGKISALTYGLRYEQFGMSSTDLELIEGLRLTKEDICAAYNFPPELLTGDKKFDNYDAAIKYLVTNTLMPELVAERNIFNEVIVPMFGNEYYVDFDITALPELQDDMGKMTESLMRMDYLTFDEKRAVMKYDSMGGPYATAYISSSLTPIDMAGQADTYIDPNMDTE